MRDVISIVEPTLVDQTGHCYSFLRSFCAASHGTKLRLWVGRQARIDFATGDMQVENFFYRKIRRLQAFALYRKLLAAGERIFVSTAGRADLALLAWAAHAPVPPKRVFLYFHWLNEDDRKREFLRKIALRQPAFEIIGPTPGVVAAFIEAGFRNVSVVPYPVLRREEARSGRASDFRHLVYAGAARQDKGFARVVDLAALMARLGLHIPIVLQTSSQHYGKYDGPTRAALARLQQLRYPHLLQYPETLSPQAYGEMFEGAICVQPYDAAAFADRVSGVTLDALAGGSPIVTTRGTWIARLVERFEAGIVVEDAAPEKLLSAVQTVMRSFAVFSDRARAGAQRVRDENGSALLFELVAA